MTTTTPPDIRELATSQEERDRANDFISRYHSARAAIMPLEFEDSLISTHPDLPRTVGVIAWRGDSIIGAAIASPATGMLKPITGLLGDFAAATWMKKHRLFSHIAVAPESRRAGLGRALVRRLEQDAAATGAVTLWGFAESLPEPSWPFYERLGYSCSEFDPPPIGGITVGQTPGARSGKDFVRVIPRELRPHRALVTPEERQ